MLTLYRGEGSEVDEGRNDSREEHGITDLEDEVAAGIEYETNVNTGWEDGIDMVLGQEFRSKEIVQDLVHIASHQNCFQVETIKSDRKRYVVKCREAKAGCKWALRAAKLMNSDSFTVRTYNKIHTCSRATSVTSRNRRKGTPRLVASVLHEDYPGRFDTPTPKNLIGMVQGRLGVKVSYSTALRGRQQAANDVRGSPEESYQMVYCYMYMLELMNPGTRTYVELDEEKRFKYLFFALGASIEGFQAMRKVIVVDGTHLKTSCGGVLIVATAQDPDHHHYPIAFGVVDGEKEASWMWFLNRLKSVIPDDPGMVFLSDRNPSLIKSMAAVFPLAEHGYCIQHLSQNVKGSVYYVNKDTCAKKFKECAHAYTESEFLTLYDAFRTKYPAAAEYLDSSVAVEKWARCYFPGERYNIDTSNIVESINGVLRKARKYSLLPMIDVIVEKIAEWFNKHRNTAAASGSNAHKLVPYVEKELHKISPEAKKLTVYELNGFLREYNVIGRDGKSYLVDMRMKTCSCKHFDIDRYPCVHAIAAAIFMSGETDTDLHLQEFSSKYYLREVWSLAYCRTIYPVPHKSDWIVPEHIRSLCVFPPELVKKPGRNQERRFPSAGEHRGGRGRGRGRGLSGMYAYFQSGSDA